MEEKLRIKHNQAAEEALMGILATSHASTTNKLKDASYSYIKNITWGKPIKEVAHNHVIQDIKRSSQALESMGVFPPDCFSTETFTN